MATSFDVDVRALAAALAGQYTLEREIGRGGMGVVYLGRDTRLERAVAIKLLPPQIADHQETRERFLREARIAAQLSHPSIVPVHRAGEIDGMVFFVMGYIEGDSLAERVRERGPVPLAQAVRQLRHVAQALAYAHARGVIHRDVKPENILIERSTGRAIVTDFGIARDERASRLTADGVMLGTVHFMSPEQLSGDLVDGRSDLYALGVVSFFALTGRLPFDESSPAAVIVAHATRTPPLVTEIDPTVPAAIATVVARCLAKDPAARYATGEEVAKALAKGLGPSDAVVPEKDVIVSEAQAAAIWERAAQLQSESVRRLEVKESLVAFLGGASAAAPPGQRAGPAPSGGFALRHVRAAAVEAGISERFVALALAELPRGGEGEGIADRLRPRPHRRGMWILGTTERHCSVSHTVRAPPKRVLKTVGRRLQQPPFDMRLRETVGGHPLEGGVMIFDLPVRAALFGQPGEMALIRMLGIDGVQITLRPLPSGPAACDVGLSVDLGPAIRRSARGAATMALVWGALPAGAAGAGLGIVLGSGLVGVLLATIGAILGGWGVLTLLRRSYRRTSVPAIERELTRALSAVEGSLQAEEVFGVPPIATRASVPATETVSAIVAREERRPSTAP